MITLTHQLKHAFAKAGLKVDLTLTPDKLSHTSKDIKVFPDQTNDPQQAYKDLLKNIEESPQIKTLDLSQNETLLQVVEDKVGLDSFLSLSPLKSIRSLNLSNCGLRHIPDLTSFRFLENVDLSNNSLASCRDLQNSNLRSLNIEGNPIEDVTINPNKSPSLETLTIGSSNTRFISFDLIRKMGDEVLQLNVSERYRDNLLLPTPDIIRSPIKLQSFLRSPRIDLRHIPDIQLRNDALTKWIQNTAHSYHELDLSNQREIFEFTGITGLHFVLALENVCNIRVLSLRNCGLTTIPNIEHLKSLQSFDISVNNITEVNAQSSSIEKIDLSLNPIVVLDINLQNFPSLTEITVGILCYSIHIICIFEEYV